MISNEGPLQPVVSLAVCGPGKDARVGVILRHYPRLKYSLSSLAYFPLVGLMSDAVLADTWREIRPEEVRFSPASSVTGVSSGAQNFAD